MGLPLPTGVYFAGFAGFVVLASSFVALLRTLRGVNEKTAPTRSGDALFLDKGTRLKALAWGLGMILGSFAIIWAFQ
jgi:hypothetical protein